jgi:hypothetical protein
MSIKMGKNKMGQLKKCLIKTGKKECQKLIANFGTNAKI